MSFRVLLKYIEDKSKQIIFYLQGFPEDSANYKYLAEMLTMHRIPFYVSKVKNYFINIKTHDFEPYYRKRFSRKAIHSLDRKEEKLQSIAQAEFRKGSKEDLESAFFLHDLRWERKAGKSSFTKGNARDFFLEIPTMQTPVFTSLLYFMTLDGVDISFVYLFHYKNQLLLKRIGHNDVFRAFNPGSIVLRSVIKECFPSDQELISFGTGDDDYKKIWTDDYYHVHSISFSSNHVLPRSIWTLKRATYFLRDKIRGNRTLLKALRKFAGRAKYIVRHRKTARPQGVDRHAILSLIKSIYSRRHYTVVGKRLEEPRRQAGSTLQAPELGCRDFAMGDLMELAALMKCRPEEIVSRLDQQFRCCLLLEKEKIVACAWFVPGSIVLPQIPFKKTVNPASVYLAEAFPAAPHRSDGEPLQPQMKDYLYQKGFRKMYYTVFTGLNSSSTKLNSSGPVRERVKFSFTVTMVLGKTKAVRTL
jgi:hypothetical protein